MSQIKLHDTVALTDDIKTNQFMTEKQIILPKGQMGTIVEEYNNGKAFEVEFSDIKGQTYALVSLEAEKIMLLYPDASNLSLVFSSPDYSIISTSQDYKDFV